jgi:hypothetical protein
VANPEEDEGALGGLTLIVIGIAILWAVGIGAK